MVEYKFEHSVPLLLNSHRYMCEIGLGLELKPFLLSEKYSAIIDTGCTNTLVQLQSAKKYGRQRNHTQTVTIGGREYDATLYTIRYFYVGNFCIRHLPVLAAEYVGTWSRNILIGASVLKNWHFGLQPNNHELHFSEVSDKYNYFFDQFGNYQEVLFDEFDKMDEVE
ncbi:MAG: aspartyl protease family protein [Defluviitaleaceae bacterium]|nr:aspartyl protease family protein [Defluviitaleaceae bacterium]